MTTDVLDSVDDVVKIRLGWASDNTLLICSRYEVRLGIFDQPSSFSFQVGDGNTASTILSKYPKGTPFQLLVNDQPQFSGYTDGYEAGDEGGPTEIEFLGRDVLAAICDTEIEKEESFEANTHLELVRLAIARVKLLKPFELDAPSVISSNSANRRRLTGTNVSAFEDDSEAALLQTAGSTGDTYKVLRTRLGEKLVNLTRRHLDAAGLFMWASAAGDIVVGVPNHKQPALWRLVRQRGDRPTSNVLGSRLRDSYKERFSEVVIFGKTTGHKYARTTIHGAYTDDELVNAGITKIRVLRDVNVTSIAHAEHIAKRELAASRRHAFHFTYTVSGHSAPCLLTNGQTRAVFAPDTVVEVVDEEYGINGPMWIEQVVHRRNPYTSTTITMLSPDTLIFGDDAFPVPR